MIRKGQQVFIKPEYQDPGDADFIWIATEDQDCDRINIMPIDCPMTIKPISRVDVYMLDQTIAAKDNNKPVSPGAASLMIQAATVAARERTRRDDIGVQVHAGKYQVVSVRYKKSGSSKMTPLSGWLSVDDVVAHINGIVAID